jgi:hypothetical protein
MSQVFQEELAFLGIDSPPAFVREPQGNGCAERFIRTLKENLLWITTFDTVEELRLALLVFKQHYNETWLIGRHGYKTPSQVRQEQLAALAKLPPDFSSEGVQKTVDRYTCQFANLKFTA